MFMETNLWHHINKIVFECHIFGVYKHKNFEKSVNIYENQKLRANKQFCLYTDKNGSK